MATPAERRYQRMTAAAMGSDSPIATLKADNLYEQMLMLLTEHRRALKSIQALDRKLQAKAKMTPEYEAYLAGVLDSNSGRQDEVLVTLMLWHIDIGAIDQALPLADYALKHNLIMPDRFERGLACTIAEEVAETAARLLESETPVSADLLSRTVALTRDHDMYDEARAKLYKQLGLAQEAAGQLQDALASYEKALKLHEKSGVKKYIEKIQRELKKPGQTEPPTTPVTTEQPEKANADAS
jgi:tetratricopeptide (TPR) repeat protein